VDGKETVEALLSHHGIKGMRWGFRKSPEERAAKKQKRADKKAARKAARAARAKARAEARIARWDEEFEADAHDFGTKVEIHNHAGDLMEWHGDLDHLNSKSEYVQAAHHGILLKDDHPVTQKYMKEYQEVYLKRVNEAADAMGTNASGTRKYTTKPSNDFLGFTVHATDVKHEAQDSLDYDVKVIRDSEGFILRSEIVNNSIAHAASFVDEYLHHHGVKGQRWGVRREKTPSGVEVKQKGKKLKTSGGKHQPAHEDAITARKVGQQAKASGHITLSNQELEAYARRLDLEQRVKRLEANEQPGAKKWIANLLKKNGNQVANEVSSDASRKVAEKISKKAGFREDKQN